MIGARRGFDSAAELVPFLEELGIEIVPFAEPHISAALAAYARFGKGIDPKAKLNLGDCAAYALAKALKAPLLYKGVDFSATDLVGVDP